MARFFVDFVNGDRYVIVGQDALHISKSLRMKKMEKLTLCDSNGMEYECEIESFSTDTVTVKILDSHPSMSEPSVEVTLYQALPKSDKMDFIVQKAVELGVCNIVPIMLSRCVSRPDDKSIKKKIQRWQRIADEAAKQSRRGKIPMVREMLSLNQMLVELADIDCNIVLYEKGGERIRNIVKGLEKSVAIIVGPEGGFSDEEIALISAAGGKRATLGNRILRTETASLATLSIIMELTGNI